MLYSVTLYLSISIISQLISLSKDLSTRPANNEEQIYSVSNIYSFYVTTAIQDVHELLHTISNYVTHVKHSLIMLCEKFGTIRNCGAVKDTIFLEM